MQPTRKRWTKPSGVFVYKLNVDASFLSTQTKGGVGGVIRDARGHFVAAFAKPLAHAASPKQSELLAIREGFDLLRSLNLHNVIIESDSMEAIAEACAPDYDLLANGAIIDDIKQTWSHLNNVKLQHCPRSCNAVAHRLAATGFESCSGTTWIGQAPSLVLDVLNFDCNHSS